MKTEKPPKLTKTELDLYKYYVSYLLAHHRYPPYSEAIKHTKWKSKTSIRTFELKLVKLGLATKLHRKIKLNIEVYLKTNT